MGAKPATVSGLSGLGDIMLTCYGSLSRNRCTPGLVSVCTPPACPTSKHVHGVLCCPCAPLVHVQSGLGQHCVTCRAVGIRLGKGESLDSIVHSSHQVGTRALLHATQPQ